LLSFIQSLVHTVSVSRTVVTVWLSLLVVCVSCVRVTTDDGYFVLDGVLGPYTEREISPEVGCWT